jgi:NADH:ubiquinone oxidoreductase subunit 5 (subunit L)/multisubunit Na+/H+ antiporter MnhA subunit
LGMIASCIGPIALFGAHAMNPYGSIVALSGTLLALPVLAFSRRYLHGEFMFGRFLSLSVGLLLGFNLVATAPNLEQAMLGWSLFGFASAFLIGSYNDRPTVRNNATFAFAVYRISDFALLTAAAFSGIHGGFESQALIAGGLLVAALFKSSQFPLIGLFSRSMEGPTPASALGYAGLSAHVGVVLLAGTMPLWFDFEWARILVGGVGAFTAVYGTILAKIRADRKGAIAHATSSTLGLIFVLLALGHPEAALIASLGHAAFRMIQILRAPNTITDNTNLRSALGYMPWPKIVSDWLYRLSWRLRRFDSDFNWLKVPHFISSSLHISVHNRWDLSKFQQWLLTGACVVLAGAPFTPFSSYLDHLLIEWLHVHPFLAFFVMFGHFVFSLVLIRFVLVRVLSSHRFRKHHLPKDKEHPKKHHRITH